AWPDLEFAEVCDLCHANSGFKSKFMEASERWKVICQHNEMQQVPVFLDDAGVVEKNRSCGTSIYMDVGVLTESEVIGTFGASPQSLSMTPLDTEKQPVDLRNEEGMPFKEKVFIIGLPPDWANLRKGMPAADILACRKMRLYHQLEHSYHSILFDSHTQLHSEQGARVFGYAKQEEVKQRPKIVQGACRGQKQHQLMQYADVSKKAEDVLQRM
ncbi:unnamed protein product, partial [Symbiodinium sp. CCMP2456]